VAVPVVGPQCVVAHRAGVRGDLHTISGVELGAVPQYVDCGLLERRVCHGIVQARRRARIDGCTRRRRGQCQGRDMPPMRPEEGLHLARYRQAVLGDLLTERQRLPGVGVAHRRPRLGNDERVVDRTVGVVDVPVVFEGAVAPAVVDRRLGDAVAECRRRVAFGRDVVGAVAQRRHHGVQLLGGYG
jgi:hypothetical protein